MKYLVIILIVLTACSNTDQKVHLLSYLPNAYQMLPETQFEHSFVDFNLKAITKDLAF